MTIAHHNVVPAGNDAARHEDYRSRRDRETARDLYADVFDDEDWGWDWEYPAPSPNRNRRRNTYVNDYDLGDGYESAFGSFSHRSRRGDMHTNFFDLDDEEEDDFEVFPRHGRRRDTYANDHDLDDGCGNDFEPYPYVGRRRNTYASTYGGRGSSRANSGHSRHRGPPRGTYSRALDSESWYGEAPER